RKFIETSYMKIRSLELHAVHNCNLYCQQCSHYSNLAPKAMITKDDAEYQINLWKNKVSPEKFSILGGEPLLYREVCGILEVSRKAWPDTVLQLVTNGFLIPKHPDLGKVLLDTNCKLEISIHYQSQDYEKRLEKTREIVSEWEKSGVKVNYRSSHKKWR